jgi:phosphoglycolate phosphatase
MSGSLIAFDLDGTLIDSLRDLADSANDLIVELGGSALPVETIGAMVGEGAGVLVSRALAAAGLVETPRARERFLEIYDGRMLNFTRPYDGIIEAVLAARDRARVVVLTNKPTTPSLRVLDALGLRHLFVDVVGGDNPLGRKPDPAALQAMMRDAGATAATTLLIGDSAIDLETARRAGVQPCLAAFGFGFANLSPALLRGDEWIAQDVVQLVEMIGRFAVPNRV